jgi:hypothetical protein
MVVSQSVGVEYSKQGVEISSYFDVFNTILPRFLSNSNSKIVINGRVLQNQNVFDETNIDVLTNDKKKFVPNHEIEQRDVGYVKLFKNDTPFEDFSSATATSYITMQGDESTGYQLLDLVYPYVLDLPGQLDPGAMDGVIEPFTIRSWATRQSIDRPHSARRVRGAISDAHEDQFGYCVQIEQKIFFLEKEKGIRPYLEYGDDNNRPVDIKSGYFANEIINPSFFEEKTKEQQFANEIGIEFAEALKESDSAFDDIGKIYISSTAGYTFMDKQNGTDSIAFLDQMGF